ncbi:hypothetical protein [Vreelandella rituensis]|nr:hypothetical protein [Halomonas rituensis]
MRHQVVFTTADAVGVGFLVKKEETAPYKSRFFRYEVEGMVGAE